MKKCPACGNSMIRVIQKCVWRYEHRRFVLKNNEFDRCNTCGKEEFSIDDYLPVAQMDRATDF